MPKPKQARKKKKEKKACPKCKKGMTKYWVFPHGPDFWVCPDPHCDYTEDLPK